MRDPLHPPSLCSGTLSHKERGKEAQDAWLSYSLFKKQNPVRVSFAPGAD